VRGGITTGDSPMFRRAFWEFDKAGAEWSRQQNTIDKNVLYGGRQWLLRWEQGGGELNRRTGGGGATIAGRDAWGQKGVALCYVGEFKATLYTGDIFENVICVLIPRSTDDLPALWLFCTSPDFRAAVRSVNQKLSVDVRYFEKAQIDIEAWRREALQKFPSGLPDPHSDDPIQWQFNGQVIRADQPLQVAVARLLGYRWPEQEPDYVDALVDGDGVVCLPSVQGEQPAAERLRAFLAAAHANPLAGSRPEGTTPPPALPPTAHEWIERLLAAAGFGGKSLEDWLRDGFFEQHCKLFQNRPFIWHVDDGLRGRGFSALVNCHKLDGQKLDRLIYTYLQSYIDGTKAQIDAGTPGADAKFKAAIDLKEKLEAIRQGEPPYDIYVRWKKLHEQPIGWNPDLNDGVRLNIRPWMTAGVLRRNPNIRWAVDRGANPDGSKRDNDLHYTRAQKEAARRAAGVAV
jgi:hypothetical protein